MKHSILFFIPVFVILFISLEANSSGAYRPPSIKTSDNKKIDPVKYSLGKKIFTGRVKLEEGNISPEQKILLDGLIANLSEKTKKKFPNNVLSSPLELNQLSALEYYLINRDKIIPFVTLYEEGKGIISGEIELTGGNAKPETEHLPKLQSLQDKLPSAIKNEVNLTSYAGKLTENQYAAIELFALATVEINK